MKAIEPTVKKGLYLNVSSYKFKNNSGKFIPCLMNHNFCFKDSCFSFKNNCPGGKNCLNYPIILQLEERVKRLSQTISQLMKLDNKKEEKKEDLQTSNTKKKDSNELCNSFRSSCRKRLLSDKKNRNLFSNSFKDSFVPLKARPYSSEPSFGIESQKLLNLNKSSYDMERIIRKNSKEMKIKRTNKSAKNKSNEKKEKEKMKDTLEESNLKKIVIQYKKINVNKSVNNKQNNDAFDHKKENNECLDNKENISKNIEDKKKLLLNKINIKTNTDNASFSNHSKLFTNIKIKKYTNNDKINNRYHYNNSSEYNECCFNLKSCNSEILNKNKNIEIIERYNKKDNLINARFVNNSNELNLSVNSINYIENIKQVLNSNIKTDDTKEEERRKMNSHIPFSHSSSRINTYKSEKSNLGQNSLNRNSLSISNNRKIVKSIINDTVKKIIVKSISSSEGDNISNLNILSKDSERNFSSKNNEIINKINIEDNNTFDYFSIIRNR